LLPTAAITNRRFFCFQDFDMSDELTTAVETTEPQPLPANRAIKNLGGNRVGGYAVLWGDNSAPDLDGEWFDPQTEELTSIYKAIGKLPYLYNHATDSTLKSSVVGVVDVMEADEMGLWYEAQLDLSNQYRSVIRNLVSEGVLGTSSGSLPGGARVEKSGRIARWPIVELSSTPTPADPRQMERPIAEIKSAFKSIGIEFESNAEAGSPEADRTSADTVAEDETRRRIEIELSIIEIGEG
jgi:hypothetical protein